MDTSGIDLALLLNASSHCHFAIIHLPNNVTLSPVYSARNLGVLFDSNLTFSQQISAVSKSCFYHIRDLRRIWNTINHTTACTIAISLIHSKLDYCNSLLLNLPSTQTKHLQLVLNAAARAVTKTPKFHHISPILKSLHWIKINERIQYKVLSLTYKTPSSAPSAFNSEYCSAATSVSLSLLAPVLFFTFRPSGVVEILLWGHLSGSGFYL